MAKRTESLERVWAFAERGEACCRVSVHRVAAGRGISALRMDGISIAGKVELRRNAGLGSKRKNPSNFNGVRVARSKSAGHFLYKQMTLA